MTIDEINIEKFEKEQLKLLIERLKDIDNYTGFKNGAYKYELGKYEANILLKQLSKQEKLIDEILSTRFFKNDCPSSISGEELDCCKDCQNDYKNCWLKYFEKEKGK